MPIVKWRGRSDHVYDFELHSMDHRFQDIAACYIFTKVRKDGRWTPIYIGQTQNLNERLAAHRSTSCIVRHGATHICVYTTDMENDQNRKLIERDLLRRLKPACMTSRQSIWL